MTVKERHLGEALGEALSKGAALRCLSVLCIVAGMLQVYAERVSWCNRVFLLEDLILSW